MATEIKHRVIDEVEKKRRQGQILHFLTGDGIGDNFFYDMHDGVKDLSGTLLQYYLKDCHEVDCFIHVLNSRSHIRCAERTSDKVRENLSLTDLSGEATIKSPLNFRNRKGRNQATAGESENENIRRETQRAEEVGDTTAAVTGHINKLLLSGRSVLIFLENLEWIANLYQEGQIDHEWIAALKRWEKSRNLMIVVTLKDVDLIQKYHFDQEEIFIGNPAAPEIFHSYVRYIFKNMDQSYKFDLHTVGEVAQSMSVGKKPLHACMRILRKILRERPDEFREEDFQSGIERQIEERVSWDMVRLAVDTKREIERAVDNFMQNGKNNPPRKGIILTGPPGTGKTMIAKSLATEKRCYFMAPTLAELKGEYVGQSSAKIRRIFAEARGNAPTILFIDEADTVFPNRAGNSGDRDSFGLDMVNQFLQELDGAKTGEQKIFTIAATNRIEYVDPAIRSRLSGTPISVPLPDTAMRQLIFDDNLTRGGKPFSLKGKLFEDEVLKKSENMSGRDITNFAKKLRELAGISNQELGNDEATRQLFLKIFSEKEKSFIEDSVGRGVFSRENIIAPEDNKSRKDSIIGYEDVKARIQRQIDYIKADAAEKKRYEEFGIPPKKGVILYGPPGNGKSELAKAMAGENGFYFFKILSQDFVSAFQSDQIRALARIFDEVIQFSKMTDSPGVMLFFDEFDSLAGNDILGGAVRGSVLNYIADENGIRNKNSKVLLMTATNYFDKIDDAIKRKGRIDDHIRMDNPDEEIGQQMLRQFFDNDKQHLSKVDDKILQEAYNELLKEVQATKGVALRATSDLMDDERKKKWLDNQIKQIRPSGADIFTLSKELKELAFYKMNGDKLTIDKSIIEERFSNRGK